MNAAPPPPRGWLATFGVAAIMLGLVVGGCIASEALANEPPRPVSLTRGVSVTAPWEWQYGGRSEDGTSILLSRGNASLAVSVVGNPDPTAALEALRTEWAADGRVTSSEIRTVEGLRPGGPAALAFAYSGMFPGISAPVEGEVTAVAGEGYVVLFDGWSGLGDYVTVRSEIEAIIRGATIP